MSETTETDATEKGFSELFEESMSREVNDGDTFTGTVVKIDGTEVYVDFGFKSEGVVPLEEFADKDGRTAVEVGDEVEVVVDRWESDGGMPRLSKRKADQLREHKRFARSLETGELIEAVVVEKVKGGLIVDVGENSPVRAFLPASQVDLRPQRDLEKFVGQKVEVRVINVSKSGVVVSRRLPLEEKREAMRKELLETLEVGRRYRGPVVGIIDRGVFVDIGGMEGYVPLSELAWGRLKDPREAVEMGQEVDVEVIRIEDNMRITLSRRRALPDPWLGASEKYPPGSVVRGKAVSVTDFGVFVELEPGLEGLVHVSELAWTRQVRHPKEVVSVGDVLEVRVLSVDEERRRLSLSLKQLEPSPWELFKEAHPPGTVVKGVVRNANDKGIFVEVAPEVVGLVRPRDISWKPVDDPSSVAAVGDEIEVVVLGVDVQREKVALGMKQLVEDPWKKALDTYEPRRSVVTGEVIEVMDAGVLVRLPEDVVGFIRASEFSTERVRDLAKLVGVGDEITAKVMGFDRARKRVNLSKRQLESEQEREKLNTYLSSQGGTTVTLGDLFGEQLKRVVEED